MIHLASIISQGIRSLDFAALLADILFYFAIVCTLS